MTLEQDARGLALEMLDPISRLDRSEFSKDVWLDPYVIGFILAFCTTAAGLVYRGRHTQSQVEGLLSAVYTELFGIRGSEIPQPNEANKHEALAGWDSANLILETIQGKATAKNNVAVRQAIEKIPPEIISKQGVEPTVVGFFWNALFFEKVAKLAP